MHQLNIKAQVALDAVYQYGIVQDGFGYEAMNMSLQEGVKAFKEGMDIEGIAAAVHLGWAKAAKAFNTPELEASKEKRERRMSLAALSYSDLSEEEKEKDRIIARVIL